MVLSKAAIEAELARLERQFPVPRIVRVSKTAENRAIRGRVVQITGHRPATPWDLSRVIVRLVESDGSLGDEYLVIPSILVAL